MNRPQLILTTLLNVLADWSSPCDEAVLHAQINSRVEPAAELSEFRVAVRTAENEGWITSVESTRRGTLWAITNKGKAERQA